MSSYPPTKVSIGYMFFLHVVQHTRNIARNSSEGVNSAWVWSIVGTLPDHIQYVVSCIFSLQPSTKVILTLIGPIDPNCALCWSYLLLAVQVHTTTHGRLQRTALILFFIGPRAS
jgi:hypothetical protein